ncbi:MAG: hypothetical protein JWN93_479, partial [Hyphomicrobiales bacterium]|nr:hypothetical protein [Hyphomicrobiales bacterium]
MMRGLDPRGAREAPARLKNDEGKRDMTILKAVPARRAPAAT